MVTRRLALPAVLALSLVLAACGGSGDEAPAAPAASQDAQAEPAPAQSTPAAPPPEPSAEPEPAPADAPVDIAAHLSQRTMAVWDAYNTHDLEQLRVFYAEDYWKQRAEEIESDMQPFKLFGVSITGEETEPPTEIEPGKWQIRHLGNFPLGSVDMIFIYEEFNGEWLLTYAEAQ